MESRNPVFNNSKRVEVVSKQPLVDAERILRGFARRDRAARAIACGRSRLGEDEGRRAAVRGPRAATENEKAGRARPFRVKFA